MDVNGAMGAPSQEDLEIFRRVMRVMNILQTRALNSPTEPLVPPLGVQLPQYEAGNNQTLMDDRMEDGDETSDSGDEILSDEDHGRRDDEEEEEKEEDDDDDDDDYMIWEDDDRHGHEDEEAIIGDIYRDQDGRQDEDEFDSEEGEDDEDDEDEDDFIIESEFDEEEVDSNSSGMTSYAQELPQPPLLQPTALLIDTSASQTPPPQPPQNPSAASDFNPTVSIPSTLSVPSTNNSTSASTDIDVDGTVDNDDGGGQQCWKHGCNGRKFATRSNLRRHLQEKSRSRPSCQCPHCGAVFSRTTARNTHVARGSCNRIRRYSNGRVRPNGELRASQKDSLVNKSTTSQ